MAAPSPSQLRLARFITLLVQDAETQARFGVDPDAEMKSAKLSRSQQRLLLEALEGEGFRKVLRELAVERERPFPDDQ